jgi:hypothetical protein
MIAARLIRALYAPERNDMRAGRRTSAGCHAVAKRRSNYSFKLTGVRMVLIEKLGGFQRCAPAA